MKKGIIINLRSISCPQGKSEALINEKNASSSQSGSLISEHQISQNTNIDLCALGVNDSTASPKYMPGDDCPNKCGGLFILLRHYTDVRDRPRFTNNESMIEKMICDICAKLVDWKSHR